MGDKAGYRAWYNTEDGSTIKPDFDKLLAKFTEAAKKQAARSPFAVDPTKLLPKTTWASKVAYPPIITGIINGFQAARAVIPTISANAALIATEVQSSKEYTQIITQLRTADTEVSKTAVVQGLLAGTPFTMAKQASVTIYKPGVDDLPGKPLASYNHVVDFDQIFAAATTAKQKDRNDLNRAIAKSQKTVEALKEHSNVIESFKSSTELLATDITACVAVRKREILWSLEDAMLGTSGLLQMRDTGIEWRSNDSNQRHLKGLRIMFKEISEATFGVMSRNIFI